MKGLKYGTKISCQDMTCEQNTHSNLGQFVIEYLEIGFSILLFCANLDGVFSKFSSENLSNYKLPLHQLKQKTALQDWSHIVNFSFSFLFERGSK